MDLGRYALFPYSDLDLMLLQDDMSIDILQWVTNRQWCTIMGSECLT